MSADDDDKAEGAEDKRGAPQGPRRQRPPVTIDLSAEPVNDAPKNDAPKAGAAKAEPPPPQPEKPAAPDPRTTTATFSRAARAIAADDGWRRTILGAVAGALIALVLVAILQAIGLLPSPGRAAADAATEQAKRAADTAMVLERRVTAIETMIDNLPALRDDVKALEGRLAAIEQGQGSFAKRSDLESLAGAVAALREKIDALPPSAARSELTALADRVGRLEVTAAAGGTGGSADSAAAIDSLTGQLSSAEATLRSLNDRLAAAEANIGKTPPTAGDRAVRAMAVAALRRAAAGDAPFAGDVDIISALGIANDEIAKLRPLATAGAASKAVLAQEFPAVADAILSASANADPDAGFFQRIWNGLGSLVTIRPTGPVAGSDPAAVVSRMQAAVDAGDLEAALKERSGLPPAGQDASAEWAKKAADRVALDRLVEQIAAALDTPKT